MQCEYEARFYDVDHGVIRQRLRDQGAECVMPRRLLTRILFGNDATRHSRSWLRLRTDGQQTALALKRATGTTPDIASIRELEVAVSDFVGMQAMLAELGFVPVRYQENYREEWRLAEVICDLDEWPDLAPFVEIEGPEPESVWLAAKKLGLDVTTATFGSVDEVYLRQLDRDILKEQRLVFPPNHGR
jgi:adenylate cyclase class 2